MRGFSKANKEIIPTVSRATVTDEIWRVVEGSNAVWVYWLSLMVGWQTEAKSVADCKESLTAEEDGESKESGLRTERD